MHEILLFHFSGETLDVFLHEDAVYGLSVDPNNSNAFASACDDGRILIYDIREPPSTGNIFFLMREICFINPEIANWVL